LLELNRGWELNFQGEAKAAIEHFQNCFKYCEEGQIVTYVHVAWLGLGWAYWLKEDLDTARTYVEKGLKIQIDTGVSQDLGLFYAFAGIVDLDCGDLKKARFRAEEGVKISQTNHQHGEGFAWILLGRTLGKMNPPLIDRAEKSLLKGIKIYEELKIKAHYVLGYFFLGEMYADTGQNDKALETFKTADLLFREMSMDYWIAKTQKILRSLEG
jgi:tetratricopeptide (TPR) repeat protein